MNNTVLYILFMHPDPRVFSRYRGYRLEVFSCKKHIRGLDVLGCSMSVPSRKKAPHEILGGAFARIVPVIICLGEAAFLNYFQGSILVI